MKNNDITAILLAAGRSERMGAKTNKLLLNINGKTPLELSAEALACAGCDALVITVSDATSEFVRSMSERFNIPMKTVPGGKTRGESVYNALQAFDNCNIAVIHDAARCLITSNSIREGIALAKKHGSAIAMTSARDTLRSKSTGKTIDRDDCIIVQTPQIFKFTDILQAYALASNTGALSDTDDCSVYERAGFTPRYFDAGITNQKLTFVEDLPLFKSIIMNRKTEIC